MYIRMSGSVSRYTTTTVVASFLNTSKEIVCRTEKTEIQQSEYAEEIQKKQQKNQTKWQKKWTQQ